MMVPLHPLQPLSNLGSVFAGMPRFQLASADENEMTLQFISVGDIRDHSITAENMERVVLEPGRRSERYQVKTNDVIIAARGTSIKSAVVKEAHDGAVISPNLIAVRLSGELLPDFLSAYFASPMAQADFEARASGTAGRLALTVSAAETLQVPVPPMDVQASIASLWRVSLEYQAMAIAAAEARRRLALQLMSDLTIHGIQNPEGVD